ncbi:hypothetical protein D3C77_543800 [compost metagenome]
MDVAAIGAVEGRTDKGVFCQFTDDLFELRQLLLLLVRAIEAAIAARCLPAQNIQLRSHAVIGLAGDHLFVFGHGWASMEWRKRG